MYIFYNIIHIFTVTSDQFNESLLNKIIHFLKGAYTVYIHTPQTPAYNDSCKVVACALYSAPTDPTTGW